MAIGLTVTDYTSGLTAASGPQFICSGPDGNLWFTEHGSGIDKVAKITTTGTITEYSSGITAGSTPYGIASDGVSALWFVERGASPKIAKITTSGTVTEYGTATSATPFGICLGPDTAYMWYTATSELGRVTVADGTIVKYGTGNGISSGALTGVCTGPDGNVWYCNSGANKIGKFVPGSTTATEYNTGLSASSALTGICSDGTDLWAVGRGTSKIVRCTTSGTITEYSTSVGGYMNCLGQDGNVWVALYGGGTGSKIARVNKADGTVDEFSLNVAMAPTGICLGPDNHLWVSGIHATNQRISEVEGGPMLAVPRRGVRAISGLYAR